MFQTPFHKSNPFQNPFARDASVFRDYAAKVLGVSPGTLRGYWKLDEPSGSATAVDSSPSGNSGSYVSVVVGGGVFQDGVSPAAYFPNSGYVSLPDVFDYSEGTMSYWMKVADGTVWTDGSQHYSILIQQGGTNRLRFSKSSTNNTLLFEYIGSGVGKSISVGGYTSTEWMHLALTWSYINDQFRAFVNGAQVGTTQTGLGLWSAPPTLLRISNSNTSWNGYIGHLAGWTGVLSNSQIASLATV